MFWFSGPGPDVQREPVDVLDPRLSPGFERVATRIGRDPIELALTGGEYYGLLFTSPLDVTAKHLATRIGHVRAEPGLRITGPDGQPLPIAGRGFDHFGG